MNEVGSTVSRSECATICPAVKNWFTVSITRRCRPSAASEASIGPCARPDRLTDRCSASQKPSSVISPCASGWSSRITQWYSLSYSRSRRSGESSPWRRMAITAAGK